MRMRTVSSSTRPWMAVGLTTVGLLASCGRPAPEEATGLDAAPDPAAESVGGSSDQAADSATDSSVTIQSETDSNVDAEAMADDGSTSTTVQAQVQTSTPTPVIITADNLTGVVDETASRAGVRVTSSNPVVAVTPVVETTPSTMSTEPGVHIVQDGDTLSVIAETYGVPVATIADANALNDVNAIKPGQELIIPAG